MRTLIFTLLAAVLGFAAGSWQRSRQEPAVESAPARAAVSSPDGMDSAQAPSSATTVSVAPADAGKSLRERLKELARPRNPLAAAAEAQALIAQLTLEDFRELASKPKEFPFPSDFPSHPAIFGRAFIDALVRRWQEVDPEGGTAAMRAVDEALVMKREGKSTSVWVGHGMLPKALARLGSTSPAILAEALASGEKQFREQPTEAAKAFEDLARIDPARASVLAGRIADQTGRIMAQSAVQKGSIRETDPVDVARVARSSDTVSQAYADAAQQGPEKLRAAIEGSVFKLIDTTALVAEGVIRDPDAAWDKIPGGLAGKPNQFSFGGPPLAAQILARELSPVDRERALATADRLPAAWKPAVLKPLVGAWALAEPQAALEWVAQKSERSDAALAAIGPWLASDPDAALAWTQGSAPLELRAALSTQIAHIFENSEDGRQKSITTTMILRAPAEQRATADALLRHSPAAAARLIAELPTAQPATTAFRPVFEKWIERDAPAAAQWLEALPAGRRRDEAVAAFAAVAAARDAEGAGQWVPTITDKTLREQAAGSVFRAMEKRDPAAAKAWRESIP
jgi:hypothetical protein